MTLRLAFIAIAAIAGFVQSVDRPSNDNTDND